MRVRGHAFALNRTQVRGYTTSWLSGCKCGWKSDTRVYSRMEAKAQYGEHLVDVKGATLGVVSRDYSTLGPGVES